jgi:3-oxoacyl-[acyl-carrier-protein] synthase-3
MDGPELVKFALERVPPVIEDVLQRSGWSRDDVQLYLLHQATAKMLEQLRDKLQLDADRLPIDLEEWGNTVSSTIPILIHNLRNSGRLKPGTRTILFGFGVGLSWAACSWTDTWQPGVRC